MHSMKIFTAALLPLLLCACATGPAITLQPTDVPSLYGDVSPTDATASDLVEVPASLVEGEAAGHTGQLHEAVRTGTNLQGDYAAASAHQCAAIQSQIERLDSGLGSPALDTAPAAPRTRLQKTGKALSDIVVQTAMGPVQFFIQAKRAIFGDAERSA